MNQQLHISVKEKHDIIQQEVYYQIFLPGVCETYEPREGPLKLELTICAIMFNI